MTQFLTNLWGYVPNGAVSTMGYVTSCSQSLSTALGYNPQDSLMTQGWKEIKAHPIAAATGAITGAFTGYMTLGLLAGGLAAIATPYLVTSPNVMSAANTALHHTTTFYYSQYIQDMDPEAKKLANQFVASVPSDQDIVVARLNTLLTNMDYPTKIAFLTYLNGLSDDQKANASTLLTALVILEVPPTDRIRYCQLLEQIASKDRPKFAPNANALGIPPSKRYECYDILKGVPGIDSKFIQQANGLLDPSMPEEAQVEVIRVFAEIPVGERDAYITALNQISPKDDVGRVQIMQKLAEIKGNRIAIANNYTGIISKLKLSSKAKLTIDQKLAILTSATRLSDQKAIGALWDLAKEYFHISDLTVPSKIGLFKMITSLPKVIQFEVMQIAAATFSHDTRVKIFTDMAKLTSEQAQFLKDHNLVGLFVDLKSEEQKRYCEMIDQYGETEGDRIANILRKNESFISQIQSSISRSSSSNSSPGSVRKQSRFMQQLDAFEQQRHNPPVPVNQDPPAPVNQDLRVPANLNAPESLRRRQLNFNFVRNEAPRPAEVPQRQVQSESRIWSIRRTLANWISPDPVPLAPPPRQEMDDQRRRLESLVNLQAPFDGDEENDQEIEEMEPVFGPFEGGVDHPLPHVPAPVRENEVQQVLGAELPPFENVEN